MLRVWMFIFAFLCTKLDAWFFLGNKMPIGINILDLNSFGGNLYREMPNHLSNQNYIMLKDNENKRSQLLIIALI